MIATSPARAMPMRASHSPGCSRACTLPSASSSSSDITWRSEKLRRPSMSNTTILRSPGVRSRLVELLLVLHEKVFGVAVVDEVLDLRGRVRGIDAGGDAPRAQHAEIAEQPLLVIVGEDGRV